MIVYTPVPVVPPPVALTASGGMHWLAGLAPILMLFLILMIICQGDD